MTLLLRHGLVTLALLCGAVAGHTQPGPGVPHIGYLGSGSAESDRIRTEAFRRGLAERGYLEGRNIIVEWRYAQGHAAKLGDIVSELAERKLQVIVVSGATATLAVRKHATSIPVVMTNVSDPVGLKLIESLAKPGGTITGLTNVAPELGAKRLELLKELAPKVSRVGVLGDPGSPAYRPQLAEIQVAAKQAGLVVIALEVRQTADLEKAFARIAGARIDGLLALQNPTITGLRARLAELAAAARLPAVYPQSEFVEAGGLASYGPDIADLHRQAASFVEKILKGAKPSELPVEQPRKYELAINVGNARRIGLEIPQQLLFRSDKTLH